MFPVEYWIGLTVVGLTVGVVVMIWGFRGYNS